MMTQKRIQVLRRALVARIRRKLRKDHRDLRKAYASIYYLLDLRRNSVIRTIDDLEAFGREIGALYEYEELKKK